MERLAIELVGGTDLEVSSPVEEDEFGGRVALNVATQSAKGESEPLDPFGANLALEVPLSISSLDSKAQEETMPLKVDHGVIHLVMRPALTLLYPDSLLGLRVVCIKGRYRWS